MYYQQPGMFVQPPPSGTVQGPVEQTTVEGAEVTFPELRMRMPSLRFPSVSRSRQNARMLMDQQFAPYVESPPVAAMPAAPAAAPIAAPMAAPAQPMMAAAPQMQMMMAPAAPQMQMMMAPAPQTQMMMVPVQMAPQQYYVPQQAPVQQPTPQQTPVQPLQAPQPEPDYSPRPQCQPQPTCDARGYPLTAITPDEKMRQLEFAEQQLKQRLEALRRQVEQVEMSRRPPTPTPDLGARALPLRPAPPAGIQPVSQPVQQPVVHPVHPAARVYSERPASYISEPRLLPQYLPPPAGNSAAHSQVIREPQAPTPTATIVGLRSR